MEAEKITMIVTRLNTNEEFAPITLEITIETVAELGDLWHRLNCSASAIRNGSSKEISDSYVSSCSPLFDILDQLTIERGLQR